MPKVLSDLELVRDPDAALEATTKQYVDGHTHGPNPPLADLAPANTTAVSGAVGVSTDAAREDHRHGYATGTPSTQAFGDAAATGSANALARSDHKHGMPALSNSVLEHEKPGYDASGGTSTQAARGDHSHGTPDRASTTFLLMGA